MRAELTLAEREFLCDVFPVTVLEYRQYRLYSDDVEIIGTVGTA